MGIAMAQGISSEGEMIGILARNNINIMDITEDYIFFEFQFRMDDGRPKWTRSVYRRSDRLPTLRAELQDLIEKVREARQLVEAYEQ